MNTPADEGIRAAKLDDTTREIRGSHTPGPWEAKQEIDGHSRLTRVTANNLTVASTGGHYGRTAPNYSEQEANARIIAASPDLLAAAIVARGFLQTLKQVEEEPHLYKPIVDTLNTAITKALGDQNAERP